MRYVWEDKSLICLLADHYNYLFSHESRMLSKHLSLSIREYLPDICCRRAQRNVDRNLGPVRKLKDDSRPCPRFSVLNGVALVYESPKIENMREVYQALIEKLPLSA